MNRRASDKQQFRYLIAILTLNSVLALLAAVVSYKALSAMNDFNAMIESFRKVSDSIPERY